jgi:hypothetical protein
MKEEKRERRGERKELTGLTALTGVRRNSEAEPSRPDSLKDESRKAASEPSVLSVVAASGAWRPRLSPNSGYRLPRVARSPPRGSLDRLTLRSSSAAAVEPSQAAASSGNRLSPSGAARDGAAALTVWTRAPPPQEPPEIDESFSLGSPAAAHIQTGCTAHH